MARRMRRESRHKLVRNLVSDGFGWAADAIGRSLFDLGPDDAEALSFISEQGFGDWPVFCAAFKAIPPYGNPASLLHGAPTQMFGLAAGL